MAYKNTAKLDFTKYPSDVYMRRSQDRDDKQVLSLESQRNIANDIIEQYKIKECFFHPPESQSAYKLGRPIFEDMMQRIESGKTRNIICWRANRLARNAYDAGRLVQSMDDGKLIAIITKTRVYRNTTDDKHDLWMELASSKKFSGEISDNVKVGYDTKYQLGEYPSHAFVGYENYVEPRKNKGSGEKLRKNIRPVYPHCETVKEAFQLAASGVNSLDDVYKFCTDKGLLSSYGNPISKQSTYDMLRRRAYTGWFWHGGSLRKGSYKPIISPELYEATQVAMGWEKGGRKKCSNFGRFFAYKGIVQCGDCKRVFTAYPKTKLLKKTKRN